MIKTNIYADRINLAESAPAAPHSSLAYLSGVLSWTKADGRQSLLIYSKSPINFIPFDGLTYKPGVYTCFSVAYRGLDDQVNISGLDLSEGMYFYLVAFNGVQSTEKYNRTVVSLYVPPASESGIFDETFDETFE